MQSGEDGFLFLGKLLVAEDLIPEFLEALLKVLVIEGAFLFQC